ncbi:MAG TPA: hypothetical protein VFY54_09470, partial [Rubrobacter sp.]|nr:hypothetical protein [Rubrobacter sp.]
MGSVREGGELRPTPKFEFRCDARKCIRQLSAPGEPSLQPLSRGSTQSHWSEATFIAQGLFRELEGAPTWDSALRSEPAPLRWLSDEEVDVIVEAIANFVDLRSPFTVGHSPGVARLA